MNYPTKEIIKKAANNTLTQEEEKVLENWLLEEETHQVWFQLQLKTYYVAEGSKKEAAFKKFKESTATHSFLSRSFFRQCKIPLSAAATVVLLLGSFLLFKSISNTTLEKPEGLVLITSEGDTIDLDNFSETKGLFVDKKENLLSFYGVNSSRDLKKETQLNILYVPNGRTFTLLLADSTRVTLNSGTKLTFPSSFNNNIRAVSLEGEAFFEVTSSKKVPFIVKTAQLKTQVYGTQFNVNAYPNNRTQKVSLLEGSVGVSPIPSNLKEIPIQKIVPNEQYEWNQSDKKYKVAKVQVNKTIQWINGLLQFDNEPLGEILKRLERKYDIIISCKNEKMKQKKFTGAFRDENLHQVLKSA